jgi:hypothetical protein
MALLIGVPWSEVLRWRDLYWSWHQRVTFRVVT